MSKLLAAAIKPAASNFDPVVRRIAECITIDPSSNNDCPTRPSNGMFYWSEGALNKIESSTTENKMMKLMLSMLALFLNLMLDSEDGLSQGSFFEEFMLDYNLLAKSRP